MKTRDFIRAITNTDFYKTGHIKQYPENTELVFSNLTPRTRKHFTGSTIVPFIGVKVFGLQAAMKMIHERFEDTFFSQPKEEVLEYYGKRMNVSLGEGAVGLEHIEALHDLGYLPIEFRTLAEGSNVPIGIPVFTVHNTLPEFYWVVNYLETVLSNETWFPMTSATISDTFRRLIDYYGELAGGDDSVNGFMCHDFSMRGMMGSHAAAISSAAHVVSFTGTDSIPAFDYLDYFYGTTPDDFIAGAVPATEHSVMCMSEEDGEIELFKRLITEVYPDGIVAIVSDTWDFWKVVTEYMVELKDLILAREGTLTLRPDSGCPVRILTGYDIYSLEDAPVTPKEDYVIVTYTPDGKEYELYDSKLNELKPIEEHVALGAVECLWNIFGGATNSLGFKTLDSHIRLIYGDSITIPIAEKIFHRLHKKGFTHNNVILGAGSYSFQYNTRDTFGFAVKATAGIVNGESRALQKKPKTDPDNSKVSARGFLKVVFDSNKNYTLQENVDFGSIFESDNLLMVRYRDGEFFNQTDFWKIRELSKIERDLNKVK